MEQSKNYIEKMAILLNLSKTDVEILMTLHERKKLLISEIAKYIKRSERHIRQRIQVLLEKGFLHKEIEVLKNKRIAYRYSLVSLQKMTIELRKYILKRLDEIEKLVAQFRSEA